MEFRIPSVCKRLSLGRSLRLNENATKDLHRESAKWSQAVTCLFQRHDLCLQADDLRLNESKLGLDSDNLFCRRFESHLCDGGWGEDDDGRMRRCATVT
jgi:hypothetical protein